MREWVNTIFAMAIIAALIVYAVNYPQTVGDIVDAIARILVRFLNLIAGGSDA